MILVGLGSSGLRALEYTLKIIKETNLIGSIKSNSQTKIYITGFDTNEVVEREVNVSLTNLNNSLGFDGVYTWTIGLDTSQSKNILSSIPNTGGVVSTKAGAGNRRKLGALSYKNSLNYPQIDSTFKALFGGSLHEVIVVGSLAGGTASGTFPIIGEDIKNWGGNNLVGLWAVGLIPGHSHESVVRKANSIAALFDLKFQQNVWKTVFVLSPQGSADGGSKYITGKGDEKEAYRALLEFTGIFISLLLLNQPLGAAGIPSDGLYSVKPSLSIVLNDSVKHNKAVEILVESLDKVFTESHKELSVKAVEKMNALFFGKFYEHPIGEGKISDHAKDFLSKEFLNEGNVEKFNEIDEELAEKTAWWEIFKSYLHEIDKELERNINDTWFSEGERLTLQSSLEDWVQSFKDVPILNKLYEKRDEKRREILKVLKYHELGIELNLLLKKWFKRWMTAVENLQDILTDYLNFSLRGEMTEIHEMIGIELNNVSFDGVALPAFDVRNLIRINKESIIKVDDLHSTDDVIKIWKEWGKSVVADLKKKLNFKIRKTVPANSISFIELKSLPPSIGNLKVDDTYLHGSIDFYSVDLNNLLIFDESVKKELKELNTFNALRFISTITQLKFLNSVLRDWWLNVATQQDGNGNIITKLRPEYAKILVRNNHSFSPVGVKGVRFNLTGGKNLVDFSPSFMGELWGWIEDYLKPALASDTTNQKALKIHKVLGG